MVNGTNFKVGDKVRIFDADRIGGGFDITNGRVYKVSKVDSDGGFNLLDDANDGLFISEDEYEHLEKVSDKPTKNLRIKSLEETVDQLKARVEQLGALVEAKQPTLTNTITTKSDVDIPGIAAKLAEQIKRGYEKQLTPNQKRKAIIAEAKAFVVRNTHKRSASGHYMTVGGASVIPYFTVKADERIVTVVLKGAFSGIIRAKASAKCAPDDVFNADIGKAIALGRALGLDVSRFEQAVKPTEVVVGQVVKATADSLWANQCGKVIHAGDGPYSGAHEGYAFHNQDGAHRWNFLKYGIIIDDTEAKY